MKIKSTVGHNVSFHKVPGASYKGAPDYITIIAGSTLELDDELWTSCFAGCKGLTGSIATGALVLVEHAKSSLTVEQVCERTLNQVGVKLDPSMSSDELQTLAHKLGVDLTPSEEDIVPEADEDEEVD
jgi:hypothetical protein